MAARQQDLSAIQTGDVPKRIIDDTAANTGLNVGCIHALTDTVFATLTDSNIVAGTMAGKTLKAGDNYFGAVTAITLTSGQVIAYGR